MKAKACFPVCSTCSRNPLFLSPETKTQTLQKLQNDSTSLCFPDSSSCKTCGLKKLGNMAEPAAAPQARKVVRSTPAPVSATPGRTASSATRKVPGGTRTTPPRSAQWSPARNGCTPPRAKPPRTRRLEQRGLVALPRHAPLRDALLAQPGRVHAEHRGNPVLGRAEVTMNACAQLHSRCMKRKHVCPCARLRGCGSRFTPSAMERNVPP